MPRNRSRVLLLMLLPTVALMPVACVGTTSPAAPVYYYALDYPPPEAITAGPMPHMVRVARFSATPPFNTQRIIYADKGLHRNAYASSQWIAPPGEMLAFALARDLHQTRAYQAVLSPDAALPSTHVVKGWVEQFLEDGTANPARAALRVNITLIDTRPVDPGERILYQKAYDAEAPCTDKTAAALAEAMSTAAAEMAAEIVRDIYDALRSRL